MTLKQKPRTNNPSVALTNQTLTISSSDSDVEFVTLTESDVSGMDTNSCNESIVSNNSVHSGDDENVNNAHSDLEQNGETIEIDDNIIKCMQHSYILPFKHQHCNENEFFFVFQSNPTMATKMKLKLNHRVSQEIKQ